MPTIKNLSGTSPLFWFHFLEGFYEKGMSIQIYAVMFACRSSAYLGDKMDWVVRLFLSDSRTSPTNSSFSCV